MAKKQEWTATGRRKRSVARVRLVGGTGNITVNGVDVNDYFPFATLVMDLKQPLMVVLNPLLMLQLVMKIDLTLILMLMVVDSQDKLVQFV